MANDEVILTQEGLEKLEDELKDLKTVKRKELAGSSETRDQLR